MIDDNTPQSYRHRLPQERRTPEVYGRAAFSQQQHHHPQQQHHQQHHHPQQQQQQLRQYEDMYNANNRGQQLPPDISSDHRHLRQQPQLVPQPHIHHVPENHINNNSSNRSFAQQPVLNNNRPVQYNQNEPLTPEQLALMRQSRPASSRERVPRPHSADFLEYERQFGPEQSQVPAPQRGAGAHHRHRHHQAQPPRPKSSIEQRIPSELRRQMIEQQNVDGGHTRLSSTTPTPRGNSNNNNNNFAYTQQQLQQLQLDNRVVNNQANGPIGPIGPNGQNNNFVHQNQRTATTPRHQETSTPNYRAQKIQYNVRTHSKLFFSLFFRAIYKLCNTNFTQIRVQTYES